MWCLCIRSARKHVPADVASGADADGMDRSERGDVSASTENSKKTRKNANAGSKRAEPTQFDQTVPAAAVASIELEERSPQPTVEADAGADNRQTNGEANADAEHD